MKLSKQVVAACVLTAALCGLAGCAPQVQGGSATLSDSAEPALKVDWSMDADCAACHQAQGESLADAACLAAQHRDVPCTSCHADSASLGAAHQAVTADDKMPKKLKETEVAEDACLSCHGGYEDLAAGTAGEGALLVDSEGTVVNPHEAPGLNADHGEALGCSSCHEVHEASDVHETAEIACSNCHHRGVYECGTCHE